MIGRMWDQFHADYPDIARPILNRIKREHVNHEAAMKDAHTRLFEQALEAIYPQWDEVRDSSEFREWLAADPNRMAAAHVPGVKAAVRLLNEFDKQAGRGKRLRAGGDEGMAVNDELPQAKQPKGADPFAGMASLADIIPTARGVVH